MTRPYTVDHALEAARAGFAVFPCLPNDKRPAIRGWQNAASNDGSAVLAMFEPRPDANPAIAARSLAIVDTDSDDGERWILERELPETATVRTRRGRHRYFRGHVRTVPPGRLAPGVEIKGNRNGTPSGYALAPGSAVKGWTYHWERHPLEIGVAEFPAELAELAATKRVRARRVQGPIFEGHRHNTLIQIAGRLVLALGIETEDELYAALAMVNLTRCRPPLRETEVRKMSRGAVATFDSAPPWFSPARLEVAEFCATSDLSGSEVAVLRCITDHADFKGTCFPSVSRISRLTGHDTRTVRKAIKGLEGRGRLEVKPRPRKSNIYILKEPPSPREAVLRGTKLSVGGAK